MFIYINIHMATVNILLTGDNTKREFSYTLDDTPAANTFQNIWSKIFQEYTGTVQHFDFECPTPTQSVEYLNQVVFNICAGIVQEYPDVAIPECWTETPYTQTSLNILHDKFAESTHLNPPGDLLLRLKDLNFAIHNLEARVLNEQNTAQDLGNFPPYVSSFQLFGLEKDFAVPLTQAEATSYNVNFKDVSCLIIGYNTLGKDLQALVFDNDVNSMHNPERYVPKTTIMSQFSMIVPYRELTDEEQYNQTASTTKRIRDWCSLNNSVDAGVDPDDFINWPGRMIIGRMPHSSEHWNWIMDQESITISRVQFSDIGELTRTVKPGYYNVFQYSRASS